MRTTHDKRSSCILPSAIGSGSSCAVANPPCQRATAYLNRLTQRAAISSPGQVPSPEHALRQHAVSGVPLPPVWGDYVCARSLHVGCVDFATEWSKVRVSVKMETPPTGNIPPVPRPPAPTPTPNIPSDDDDAPFAPVVIPVREPGRPAVPMRMRAARPVGFVPFL
jgi:hypothetical protein